MANNYKDYPHPPYMPGEEVEAMAHFEGPIRGVFKKLEGLGWIFVRKVRDVV